MEESNENEKKSQEAIQAFQEKYDQIKKYLEKLDELFIGNNVEARIIIPYMNLNMINKIIQIRIACKKFLKQKLSK